MGIRTRFNPLGGVNVSSEPSGDLSEWRYSTDSNGKITLYEYLGQDTAIDVPTKNTVINCYYNADSIGNIPFYNNQNIVSVDLNYVPFVRNSMDGAFVKCEKLENVKKIPNSVTSMERTFANCTNLVNAPIIPNSVTNMYSTFANCTNLINAPIIPNSVTNMSDTFWNCTNIVNAPTIPNSVEIMAGTFRICTNLINAPIIPNSVTNMSSTFLNCTNLVNAPTIPNSVTNMYHTFQGCTKLKNINICSSLVVNADGCFRGRGSDSTTINVYIPYRYINNALTTTRNSFNSAGYVVGTGVGNATINNCVMYDYIAKDYSSYVGNGTHWHLSKYSGSNTRVVVQREYTTYDTFPTAIQATCFAGNTTITDVNCNNVEFTYASSANAFNACTNLVNITNINLYGVNASQNMFKSTAISKFPRLQNSSDVLGVQYMFYGCNSVADAFSPYSIPLNATNMHATFCNCESLMLFSNLYIGKKVANMHSTFKNCINLGYYDSNIHIFSPSVGNITNCFRSYNASLGKKNLHMYFTYSNGKATTTYSKFNSSAIYRNNATSNFYMIDISGKYGITDNFIITNNLQNSVSNANEMYLYKYIGHSDTVMIPRVINTGLYPDVNQEYNVIATSNAFTDDYKYSFVNHLDLNNVPFINNYIDFSALQNLITVNNISNSITNMATAFQGCTKLQGNMYIYSQNITNADRCFSNLTSTLNVYFPFKYENGQFTKTYNSFMNQTYTGITYKDLQGV